MAGVAQQAQQRREEQIQKPAHEAFPSLNILRHQSAGLVIGKGSTGQIVQDLQYMLRELGYYDGPINGVITSKKGDPTIAAIKAFQKIREHTYTYSGRKGETEHSLTVDGKVGWRTIEALDNEWNARLRQTGSAPRTEAPVPINRQVERVNLPNAPTRLTKFALAGSSESFGSETGSIRNAIHHPHSESTSGIVNLDIIDKDGMQVRLAPAAGRAFDKMYDDAAAAGIKIVVVDSFRSREEQFRMWKSYHQEGNPNQYFAVSHPDKSTHPLGTGIDIRFSNEGKAGYDWLLAHGANYGFELRHHSGHFEYVGGGKQNPNSEFDPKLRVQKI